MELLFKIKKRIKVYQNSNHVKRALFLNKFVDWKTSSLSFIVSFIYFFYFISLIDTQSRFFLVLICIPVLFLTWFKSYQIIYDLKLLFMFDDKYDVKINLPKVKEFPTITFIVPSYHEPFNVAKLTFDSIVDIPYRGNKEIIVVDNSKEVRTEDFLNWMNYVKNFDRKSLSEDITTQFIHNKKNETLKPGNLDLAQSYIKEGEFVVILDVDSTLPEEGDLLERAVIEFEKDHNLGLLQFCIKATNNHFNHLTQAIATTQDLMRLRMISRGYGGYKIFEGHNGIWRKTVLDEIGSWVDYYKGNIMVTEDILKSAEMYDKGYYGKPLNIVTGEWIPNSLTALESMWMRWTYGTSQVLFKHFDKIYSKNTLLIEKLDITYHILHHIVAGLTLPIAILLQLFFKGSITNFFILTTLILPQLIGAIVSYFTSVKKENLSLLKKIKYLYAGFFLVDIFIMVTQIRSVINFMFNVKQGWSVTQKGVENTINWKDLLISKSFFIGIFFAFIGIVTASWFLNYQMIVNSLIHHFSLLFISINLLFSICIYGKQGRNVLNKIESAGIN